MKFYNCHIVPINSTELARSLLIDIDYKNVLMYYMDIDICKELFEVIKNELAVSDIKHFF